MIQSSVCPDGSESDEGNSEVPNEELDATEQHESGAFYMRLPPFGSPQLRLRPSTGRKSLDHPNDTSDGNESKAGNA